MVVFVFRWQDDNKMDVHGLSAPRKYVSTYFSFCGEKISDYVGATKGDSQTVVFLPAKTPPRHFQVVL